MASLRFSLTNLIESAALKNGTGGGAPADDEVSPWLMENAQNRDRGMVWQAAASLSADFYLASTQTVAVWALLGARGAPSSGVGIASCDVKRQTGAYTPGGAFTTMGTITMGSGVRDGGLLASGSTDTARFTITATTAFTLGRLWAGLIDYDLGIVSSPGYSRRWIDPTLENRMADQSPFVTYSGNGHWEYTLPYEGAGSTLFAKLLAIGQARRTFLLIDRDSTVFEARIRSPFEHSLMHDFPDWQNSSLLIETLG